MRSILTLLHAAVLLSAGSAFAQATGNVDPALDAFVKSYKSRGQMEDGSQPLNSAEAMKHFHTAPGLTIELVAHEPAISQPIEARFDERGRMWIVQYLQFPFPAGLKVLKYDEHLRAVYDRVPEPPPRGVKGADKITILEDRDGDGTFETQKDFVTGLNMATSVLPGRGGVWVMNAPYLLFYPDKNHDDVPDGDPEVRLSGFGMEDTHALANGLRWGPDGWLYGVTGSTVTATVRGYHWLGQAVWRYQPETDVFEIFCEGGGNTWAIEFDSKGRMFTGTNFGLTARGLHYVQGGYYIKNFAKHGPLTNPYAFGYFEHMTHHQPEALTHVCQPFVICEDGPFPERFHGRAFTGVALSNRVESSTLKPAGTTFQTEDTEPLVTSDDRWFRPVSLSTGPDGAIYLADWYDSRLTNLDPRDTWDHERGRIYRLRAENAKPLPPFDLAMLSAQELLTMLKHEGKWQRQTVLRVLYDRHDTSLIPQLAHLLADSRGQDALEYFWALNACGGFNNDSALQTLTHTDEFVRAWTLRLIGDAAKALPPALQKAVEILAGHETSANVRSQLASALKRLPAESALPILRLALSHGDDADDPHIPLLLWWALESKAASHRDAVLALMNDAPLWNAPLVRQHLLSRLGQRYTAERSEDNLNTAARLLALSPSPESLDALVTGMEAGLQGDRITKIPAALKAQVATLWNTRPHTPVLASFAFRLDHPPSASAAVQMLDDSKTTTTMRKGLLSLLSERRVEAALPVITKLFIAENSEQAQLDLLNALTRFNSPTVSQTILRALPGLRTKLRIAAITALSGRAEWARALLDLVDHGAVKKEQVAPGDLLVMQKLGDAHVDALLKKHWGNLRASSAEKETLIKNLRIVLARPGDAEKGKLLFRAICSVCHTLKGEGGKIGPDLTGYERDNLDFLLPAIIDPSLGIREEYTLYSLTTREGQVLVGFAVETTPQFVTMQDAANNRTKIAREDIRTLTASPLSLMPEGLLNALTSEQTRDLFTYLRSK